MEKLIQQIEHLHQELPKLKKHNLKETPTRTIIIDQILRVLGWNVLDPDEVQLEYPTVDGKSVDYALKLNRRTVLLIEAKALNDSLDDVKAVTQVVGYAANNGIVWCILTNGIKWRIYRSMEKCAAPDKLVFEVDIAPNNPDNLSVQELAQQLWLFSYEEMIKGTIDIIGTQKFIDKKVKDAFDKLMKEQPIQLINLIKNNISDTSLQAQQIRDSLKRVLKLPIIIPPPPEISDPDEKSHTSGKSQDVIDLYNDLKKYYSELNDPDNKIIHLKQVIDFRYKAKAFCSITLCKNFIKITLRLKINEIINPPVFLKDVSNIGHWGVGDVELKITNKSELRASYELIRQSYLKVKNS